MERKVWATTTKGNLYPNMYLIIVGPAGTGKSLSINSARFFLEGIEDPTGTTGIHLAPTSMTMASMADELLEAKRVVLLPGQHPPTMEYNALTLCITEFSSFLSEYDKPLMGGLTDLWDNGQYSESRRGNKLRIKIPRAQINMMGASTASNLVDFMPERAWDQGFASRMIMVYSGDRPYHDIFEEIPENGPKERLRDNLVHDLRLITEMTGKMVFLPEAINLFRAWREGGELPVPDHPKLKDYATRRTAHLIKLCMVVSASRGADLNITAEDFELAKNWLLGAELTMPDVFAAGNGGGDSKAMDETWHFILTETARRKGPIPEHEVVHFVRERVPSHSVMRVLEIMERDGSVSSKFNMKGVKTYEPGPRKIVF